MENQIEAQTYEWIEARKSRFTGSKLYELIKKPRGEFRPYVLEKAAEILTGESQEKTFVSDAMVWGIENQPRGLAHFARLTGHTLAEKELMYIHPSMRFAVTPDNVATKDDREVVCEIKCPDTKTHIRYCMLKDWEDFRDECPEYFWQVVSGCLVTGTPYAAFISFDPRIDHSCGLFVLEFKVPDEYLIKATEAILAGEKQLNEIIERLTPTE